MKTILLGVLLLPALLCAGMMTNAYYSGDSKNRGLIFY